MCLELCPETRSLYEHGDIVCSWTLQAALSGTTSNLYLNTEGKRRMEEDIVHTFENFKVVPNLVLMIHVSAQSTLKGLKSAR